MGKKKYSIARKHNECLYFHYLRQTIYIKPFSSVLELFKVSEGNSVEKKRRNKKNATRTSL